MTLLITEQDCKKLLNIQAAIPVTEEVFRMAGLGSAEDHPRLRIPVKKGKGMQFRAAVLHAKQVMGFKLSTNFGSGHTLRWDFLYDTATNELLAIVQSTAISAFRTCATSGVAIKHLSPPTASVVGVYGSGRLAAMHLDMVCAVRPIKTAYIYSRNADKREAFCRKMSEQLGIKVIPAQAPEQLPREADIIITVTNSTTPVLSGDWIVRPGLVVGVGANEWYEREVDEKLVEKAKRIFVDSKEHSKAECGDLLWPIAHGLLRWEAVEDLGQIVAGRAAVPDFSSDLILFESQGLAIEDVAIAAKAYELARAQGVGSEISL